MSEEEQIILPDGFKRVEYLQSSGTQWIQTDYCPCSETKIVSNCYFIKAGTNGRFFGNGSAYSGGTDTFTTFMSAYATGAIILDFGNIRKEKNNYNLSVGKHTIIVDKNGIMVDGTMALDTNHTITFQSTHSLSFFAAGGETTQTGDHWRIYDFIIYERGEVICHFIPCLNDDNEPCMYDVINKKSYTNAGTGQFYYPRDYPSSNYNLPAGFKKCVYLQSDGTQWINTGVIPDNETGLYFKALQLTYGNFMPFGVNEGSNWIYPPRFSNKDLYYRCGETAVKMMTWDKAGDLIFHSSLNLYNSKIARFDSEDTDVESSITSQTGTYTIPIWLFSCNVKGSYSATYGKWIGRIYRAQITQGDALIHDYVPCFDTNTNRPCMYDLIEQEALYNQSGGTEFAYCVEHQLPSDFVKLKYLEASGTQYIKTCYVPTNTTGLYIDTQDVGSGDTIPMGLRESSSTDTRFFITRQTASVNTGYGWGAWTQVSTTKGSVRYDSTLNWLNDRKSITNNPLFSTIIKNLGELSFTPSLDIWMFGINQGGRHAYKFKGRIYRAKISEGSEIIRDFVPAWDDRKSKPCMYDLINNVAYYNDGEGEFLTNRDVEGTYKGYTGLGCIGNRLGASEFEWKIPYGYRRVAYLESSGEQFIDTKYVPTNNTGLKTIAKQISIGDLIPVGCRNDNSSESRFYSGRITLSNSIGYGWGIWNMIRNNDGSGIQSPEKFTSLLNYKNNRKIRIFSTKYNFNAKLSELSFIPLNSLHIFGANINNQNQLNWKGRIYEVEISEFETVIHHFIPCIDPNNKPCMFDLITQQPFYNQGDSEDFTYGPF